MDILVAKSAGFCFGVKKAVDKVYDSINEYDKKIYTYGQIIHNESVVLDLVKKGVDVIENEDQLKKIKDAVVVIRSHGVSKKIYDIIEENHLELVDATCPFVKKIHRTVEEKSKQGMKIIIVGDKLHPEIEGIVGWCLNEPIVIKDEEDINKMSVLNGEKLCIVSQTTFNYNKFQYLVEIMSKKGYDIVVVNTICNATNERQTETLDLARKVDAMIVIGGKNSSNTAKLYEISKKECKNTCFIQTAKDLESCNLSNCKTIGITAGASTPNNIIEEVQANVRIKF